MAAATAVLGCAPRKLIASRHPEIVSEPLEVLPEWPVADDIERQATAPLAQSGQRHDQVPVTLALDQGSHRHKPRHAT